MTLNAGPPIGIRTRFTVPLDFRRRLEPRRGSKYHRLKPWRAGDIRPQLTEQPPKRNGKDDPRHACNADDAAYSGR